MSAIWYPQPFGIQAEWNWGTTPDLDLATNSIVDTDLAGGYVQAMYQIEHRFGTFLRVHQMAVLRRREQGREQRAVQQCERHRDRRGVADRRAAGIGGGLPSHEPHQRW